MAAAADASRAVSQVSVSLPGMPRFVPLLARCWLGDPIRASNHPAKAREAVPLAPEPGHIARSDRQPSLWGFIMSVWRLTCWFPDGFTPRSGRLKRHGVVPVVRPDASPIGRDAASIPRFIRLGVGGAPWPSR